MQEKHIVIAGGSGFIGMQLAHYWSATNRITILTRDLNNAPNNSYGKKGDIDRVKMVKWDGCSLGDWVSKIEGCNLLVNLSGKSVNCRYNDRNKADVLSSRVDSTRILGEALKRLPNPPELWVNSASATIYRHAEDRPQDEFTGEMENDFSVQVCKAWEKAFNAIELPLTRKIILRMAIVLGKGGVLVPYSRLAKLGLGGRQGNGNQMFSWVHIEDLARIIEWLNEHKDQSGVFNASAPGPVHNYEFMQQLRSTYHIPIGLPAPKWLLEIAAFLIGTETELLLKSRWVLPAKLVREGFSFKYRVLEDALKNLLQVQNVKAKNIK